MNGHSSRGWVPALTAGMVVIAGCSATAGDPNAAPASISPAPVAESSTSGGTATGPAYDSDFPDPDVVALAPGQGYLGFATNGNGRNVQTVGSTDLKSWNQLDDALPVLPDWTTEGKVWAPEVIELDGGRWAMYYTTMAPDPTIQCAGVALADQAAGPYRDTRSGPLVCETKTGGSIDAHPFRASDGSLYLFWKNDGNAIGVDTWISGQRLAADGVTLQGKPQRLFKQDLPWEGDLVEAPFLWEHDGKFLMFYSANSYASADYAVGYAMADSPLGPYTKHPEPILVSDAAVAGPGHCSLFTDDQGQVWMAYHAWPPDAPGDDTFGRSMWLAKVSFSADGSPVVTQPGG